jgi:hypothetical protein
MHLQEGLLREEFDRLIAKTELRIAEQQRRIEELKTARKPIRNTKQTLAAFRGSIERLLALRRRYT